MNLSSYRSTIRRIEERIATLEALQDDPDYNQEAVKLALALRRLEKAELEDRRARAFVRNAKLAAALA